MMRLNLYDSRRMPGVKHGVVQDKLWLPGIAKAENIAATRFFRQDSFGARRVRLLGI